MTDNTPQELADKTPEQVSRERGIRKLWFDYLPSGEQDAIIKPKFDEENSNEEIREHAKRYDEIVKGF